jgi:hypothetical protein
MWLFSVCGNVDDDTRTQFMGIAEQFCIELHFHGALSLVEVYLPDTKGMGCSKCLSNLSDFQKSSEMFSFKLKS